MISKQRIKEILHGCENDFCKDAVNDETVDEEAIIAYLSDFVDTVIDIIDDTFPDEL